MRRLLSKISATKMLCQTLLDRQVAFERRVCTQLTQVQDSLEDLLVLSPRPFHAALPHIPSPTSPVPSDGSFSFPDPFAAQPLSSSPHPLCVADLMQKPKSAEPIPLSPRPFCISSSTQKMKFKVVKRS